VTAPAPGLRIGDTQRAAAADRLAWHFSHGRLEPAELDERLGRAMRATTADDLTALFADLPAVEPVPPAATRGREEQLRAGRPPHARRAARWLILMVALVAVAALVAHALTHSLVAWALVLLIGALWLRRGRVRDRGSPPSTR
jgi:Flp pilus assembly protein TadB